MSESQFYHLPFDPEEDYTERQLLSFLAECFGSLQTKDGRPCAFIPWRGGFCYVLPPRKGFPSAKLYIDDGTNRSIDPMEVFCNTLGKGLEYDEFRNKYCELMGKHREKKVEEEEKKPESDSVVISKSRLLKLFQEWLDGIK